VQITRISLDTQAGPSDWFTGSIYIDTVAAPSGSSRPSASSVHFTPGARIAWHTHPNGQTIYVLEGVGFCQVRGGPIEVIRPGDRVFEPNEEHWHGAAATRFMTHLAMSRSTTKGTPRPGATTPATASTRRRRRVKAEHLKPLHEQAVSLIQQFPDIKITWVPRKANAEADALASTPLGPLRPKPKPSIDELPLE
jgi:quercetin dioxygenase-like cupin family protein